MALASLAVMAPAQGEESRERHEYRPSEGARQAVRRPAEARQSRHAYPARVQDVRAGAARQQASYTRQHPVVTDHREWAGRGINEQRQVAGTVARENQFAGGGRVREAQGQLHVVRYGNNLSGTVEHTIRPGLLSRTFVSGGHVLYTHVFQRHVWYQFGRAIAYETYVPAVRYPPVYYAWSLAAWPRPIIYNWGWQVQPWYPVYGSLFTPYPVYTSPDLWMTDYILSQNMQAAYQVQTPAPTPEPPPQGALAPAAPGSSVAPPPADASEAPPAPQGSAAPPAPQPSDTPPAPAALPPAITPQVKAQLNAQIKVRLQEQRAATATPAVLTTQSTPPALRPNHVFFQVVQPLEVPSGTANRSCSLSPNDFIKRIGGMSNDDWMIPVVVELSGRSDCPEGLQTRIGLNDLNAMENEQEAQVMEALDAASKHMGPNGPPSGPGVHPTLIADGNAAPDPLALDAIRQTQ
jgi:hypothetical protein